jgi:AcrR family transcriptional regulator
VLTKGTPRERRHERTKQRILDSAREILVTEGMAGLSMRGLAEQIDYTPSAIYKYFRSKEDILQAIRQEGFALSAKMHAEAASRPLPAPEKLVAAGRAYLRFAETYPQHYLLMFNSPELPPGGVEAVAKDPNFSGVPQIVREGVEQGYFRLPPGYTPEMMAFQCWITAHGMAMLKLGIMRGAREEFAAFCDQLLVAITASFTVK